MSIPRGNGRRKTEIPGQRRFDFARRMQVLRKAQTGDTHAKHLLRVLDDHCGDGTDCRLFAETIALEMECSPRTVKRALAILKEKNLVIVFRKSGRHHCNRFRLRRAEMRELAGLPTSDDETKGQSGPSVDGATGQPGPMYGPTGPHAGANLAPPKKPYHEAGIEAHMDGKHVADGVSKGAGRDGLHMENADFESPESVDALFRRFLESGKTDLVGSATDLIQFHALVCHVARKHREGKLLEKGEIESPPGFLRWLLIGDKDGRMPDPPWRERITCADEDSAERFRDRRRGAATAKQAAPHPDLEGAKITPLLSVGEILNRANAK